MKLLLIVVMLLLFITTKAQQSQDCNERPVLIVMSGSIGFTQYLEQQFKIGIWDNHKSTGLTVFAGYRDNIEVKKVYDKIESKEYISSFFGEIGYHIRVSPNIVLHGLGGADAAGGYAGIEAMYQATWNLLISATYKRKTPGISIYFRLN